MTAALVLAFGILAMAGWMAVIYKGAHRFQWHYWQIGLMVGWLLAIAFGMPAALAVLS